MGASCFKSNSLKIIDMSDSVQIYDMIAYEQTRQL